MRKSIQIRHICFILISTFLLSMVNVSYGQRSIHLELGMNKNYPQSFMSGFSGNIDLGYANTFGESSAGWGANSGLYIFNKTESGAKEYKF